MVSPMTASSAAPATPSASRAAGGELGDSLGKREKNPGSGYEDSARARVAIDSAATRPSLANAPATMRSGPDGSGGPFCSRSTAHKHERQSVLLKQRA